MKYYQRLKDLRDDKDMVQKEVAHILKISQQQYALYEQGIREMPIHHYETLARFYNVTIEYMIGMTDEPNTLDGTPYRISKNINITDKGGKIKKTEKTS